MLCHRAHAGLVLPTDGITYECSTSLGSRGRSRVGVRDSLASNFKTVAVEIVNSTLT